MSKVASFLRSRAKVIAFWLLVIAAAFTLTTINRNRQAGYEAALENPASRDATVASLVGSGTLVDVLSNTQDPTGDSTSDIAKRSITIRQEAAASVSDQATSGKLDGPALLAALFTLRKDGDGKVKDSATAGLVAWGKKSDANLNTLAAYLKDGDPDVRSATVDALAAIGGEPVAKLANSYIKDETAQDSAVSVLAKVGAPSIPMVESHLDDPILKFRLTMVDDLKQIGAPSTVPTLLKIADDQSQPSMRRAALTALTSIVQKTMDAQKAASVPPAAGKTAPAAPPAEDLAVVKTSEPTLIGCLKSASDDGDIRAQAALTLGSLGGPDAVQALIASIGDFDTQISDASRDALARIGSPSVPGLTNVLHTGADNARIAAAQSLGAIASPGALSSLASVMSDPKTPDAVRRSAVMGLGVSGNTTVIPSLVAALGDRSGIVADAAAAALLSDVLAPQAVDPLIATFSKSPSVAFNASRILSQMGVLAIPGLMTAANSPNPQVQTWAAVSLGQSDSHDQRIVAALTPLTSSDNPDVKFAASEAMQRLKGS